MEQLSMSRHAHCPSQPFALYASKLQKEHGSRRRISTPWHWGQAASSSALLLTSHIFEPLVCPLVVALLRKGEKKGKNKVTKP